VVRSFATAGTTVTGISPIGSPVFIQPSASLETVSQQLDTIGGGDSGLGPQLNLDLGTPQGLGYDEGSGEFLTTYYDAEGVTLLIQGKAGMDETSVELGGGDGHGAPTKGGGVATDGDYVYVADGGELYVYSRTEIDAAAGDGRPAVPEYVKDDIAAGSYVEVKDGKLYVGDFNTPPDGPFEKYQGEPRLYQYDIHDGVVADDYNYSVKTPYYVQDVAITDEGLLFSRSYSNKDHSPHYLTMQEGDALSGNLESWQDAQNVREIPYYSEGISILENGAIYVVHESGSYNSNGDSSDTHVQRTSLDELAAIGGPQDPPEPESFWDRLWPFS